MKINWNKKYTTYAIYAAIVSAAVIFCIFVGVYIKDIWGAVLKLFDVLAPLIYGLIIAYILTPLSRFFEKKVLVKIRNGLARRLISVFLTYIVFLSVLGLIIYAVLPQLISSISQLQEDLIFYSQGIEGWLDEISRDSKLMAALVSALKSFIDFSIFTAPLSKIVEVIYGLITEFSPHIMGFISTFLVQLKNIIIGVVFSGYILVSRELLFAQISKLMHVFFKKERLAKIKAGVSYADKTFGKYLMGTLLDALIVGSLTAVVMLILGIPYVPLVATLIACTNIIPIFGPFIGAIPSVLIIFIESPFHALLFIISVIVIQQIDGNLIAPRILGSSTGLPALYVIIAITVMGGLFGIVGMVIGIPVFAIIGKLISDKTEAKLKSQGEAESSGEDASSAPENGESNESVENSEVSQKEGAAERESEASDENTASSAPVKAKRKKKSSSAESKTDGEKENKGDEK